MTVHAPIRAAIDGHPARIVDGLPRALDRAAAAAPASHGFLRAGWFAAAVGAYGGQPRTLVIGPEDTPLLALPMVAVGPRALGLWQLPGSYWPFRSFPLAAAAPAAVLDTAVTALGRSVRALRIGPVYDDDPAAMPLLAAARARGWRTMSRRIADAWILDIAAARADGPFPRTSTLKKNRFHEKHLAAHGTLDWRFLSADDWTPALFDALAGVEAASWIARTGGEDAKFTSGGHGAFWRTAVKDPVLADAMRAAVLTIDGRAAAFSFDLAAGPVRYAIANSYDPAFARHSPGKLLYWRNIAHAAEGGTRRVDWGAGDSGYKRIIGAVPGPVLRDWLMIAPGVGAALGACLAPLWRRSGNRG